MLPDVRLCKQMTLMHVNLGGSKRLHHYSSQTIQCLSEPIGEKLEHFQDSSPAGRKRFLIENDFRLLYSKRGRGLVDGSILYVFNSVKGRGKDCLCGPFFLLYVNQMKIMLQPKCQPYM